MNGSWNEYADRACSAIRSAFIHASILDSVSSSIADAISQGNKILFAGTGGSAADSQHIAGEFVGRFRKDRLALPAIALSADSALLTAIGNDYGFDCIFSRQVEALGKPGDVLVAFTTSGRSANIIAALYRAKSQNMTTIVLCGRDTSRIEAQSDFIIAVDSDVTSHIQEAHHAIGQAICAEVEIISGLARD